MYFFVRPTVTTGYTRVAERVDVVARNPGTLRSSWFDTAEPPDRRDEVALSDSVVDIPERVIAHDPPIANVTAPDITDRLPSIQSTDTRPVAVVGAHGGAGATSVAASDPELLFDCGAAWPSTHGKQACVLVARTSARGLHAAQTALQQWAAAATPSVDVLGLVLIADAPGKLPKPLKDLLQVVSGGAPRTWHLPWDPAMRLDLENTLPTRRTHKLIRNLNTLVQDQ